MNNNRFIDSNILIYAYSKDEPEKRKKAINLLSDKNLFLSTQVINEYIWVMRRKYGIAISVISEIISIFFKLYKVVQVDEAIILKALQLCQKYKYSYWDSLILAAAIKYECEIVYSEDMQDTHIIENKVTILNPFN